MRKTLIFAAMVLMCTCVLEAGKTKHIIVAVMDGARYSETLGDTPHQYIPKIWNMLRPQGTIFTSYYNQGLTETNPGHSAIVTGRWQNIKNDGTERPHSPTIFEYYQMSRQGAGEETFVVLGKSKLDILAYSDHALYGPGYQASVMYSVSQYDDGVTLANIKSVVASYHPRLLVTNFAGVDNAGHSGNWTSYLAAIQKVDSLLYNLWNDIQADPILSGVTTLIVTNDHGRHLDGWSSGFSGHGDGCDGCRHVMLLVVGPDTPAGGVDSSACAQIDITPTIGSLIGVPTPLASGKVLTSAVVTGVETSVVPLAVQLWQNFPNPFNPETGIRYQLPGTSDVRLTVYDMLGREVSVLVNERREAGVHEVRFNAAGLASGVYFYRMSAAPLPRHSDGAQGGVGTAGLFTQTRKLLLLK